MSYLVMSCHMMRTRRTDENDAYFVVQAMFHMAYIRIFDLMSQKGSWHIHSYVVRVSANIETTVFIRLYKISKRPYLWIRYRLLQWVSSEILDQEVSTSPLLDSDFCYGAWWLSGRFGALGPEGRRFESHSSRHAGTLDKSLTRSCQ